MKIVPGLVQSFCNVRTVSMCLCDSHGFPTSGCNMVAMAPSITLIIPRMIHQSVSLSTYLSICQRETFHYMASDTHWVTCLSLVQLLSKEDWVAVIGLDQWTHPMELDPAPWNKIRVIWARKGEGLLGSQLSQKYLSLKIISFFSSYGSYHKRRTNKQKQKKTTKQVNLPWSFFPLLPTQSSPPSPHPQLAGKRRMSLYTVPSTCTGAFEFSSIKRPSQGPFNKARTPLLPARTSCWLSRSKLLLAVAQTSKFTKEAWPREGRWELSSLSQSTNARQLCTSLGWRRKTDT